MAHGLFHRLIGSDFNALLRALVKGVGNGQWDHVVHHLHLRLVCVPRIFSASSVDLDMSFLTHARLEVNPLRVVLNALGPKDQGFSVIGRHVGIETDTPSTVSHHERRAISRFQVQPFDHRTDGFVLDKR